MPKLPYFDFLDDHELERLMVGAWTELERRRAEREKVAYAKRMADARRSDEELKALLAAKVAEKAKRQELMDRADKLYGMPLTQCPSYYKPLKEPRRVSLSHWGLFEVEVPTSPADTRVRRYQGGAWVN